MYVNRHSTETMMACIAPADSRRRGMIRTRDMAQGDVRTKMVKGAAGLLATKGVEGTSFAEVLAATDAPRGSIYHHFPGGKSELVHAALDLVSTRALAVMESRRGSSAEAIVEQFLDLWRQLLDHSELTAGCAVLAVTVAGSDDDLLDHTGSDLSRLDGPSGRTPRRRGSGRELCSGARCHDHRGDRGSGGALPGRAKPRAIRCRRPGADAAGFITVLNRNSARLLVNPGLHQT